MKRYFLLIIMAIGLVGLTACGGTESEDLGGKVKEENAENAAEVNNEGENEAESENEAENESAEKEINELIVDNDNLKATLVKITKESDSIFGDSYKVIFEVENKLDHSIEVQARSVSADGMMVDEALLSMSQEVAPGKKAKAVLDISDFEGYDFPEMEEDFEMTLHIFSFDDFDYTEDHEVKVEF